ncbi:hypothetical protein ABZ419_24150 [Streptomyces cinnamoneus]|uniref:hypothetical protein n=1 Tax=Streptomyces cinnamoneus TaxID=53446 RepID=UPI00340A31E9
MTAGSIDGQYERYEAPYVAAAPSAACSGACDGTLRLMTAHGNVRGRPGDGPGGAPKVPAGGAL